MTCRADLDVQRLVDGRARGERVAAAARDLDLAVLRMNARLHCVPRLPDRPYAGRLQTPCGLRPAWMADAKPNDYVAFLAATQQRQDWLTWVRSRGISSDRTHG